MKTLLVLLFLFPVLLFAQAPQMSLLSQEEVLEITKDVRKIDQTYTKYAQKYPLMKINGKTYVSFLGKLRNDVVEHEAVIIGEGVGKIRSVRIEIGQLNIIPSLTQFEYLEIAGKIQPYLDKVNFDTRADSVHHGYYLPQPYTGKDVIIGVQDWGFDYTSPMFYDTLLEDSRILAAWDQWKTAGNNPQAYSYGAEYADWDALEVAQSDTANQYSYGTHATHVSGIAGGSGAGTKYLGMAFESEFIFSTILLDEAAAIDSWNWMLSKAQEYQKNLVVNMSWGLYNIGTSDGTSLMSQAIEELTDQGMLFVSSAGNNGNVNFHFQYEFENDSIKSKIQFDDYVAVDSLFGQSIHGWGEAGNNFAVKLEILSNNILIGASPYFSTASNTIQDDYIVVNNDADTIWYKIVAEAAHPQNSKPYVYLRIKNEHPNLQVVLSAKASEGSVHFWNVTDLTFGGGNWGMPFESLGAGYISGDNEYGIGEPTCADDCITIASHAAESLSSQGNILGGKRSTFSSVGPRMDGAMKPDVSAPGANVVSSMNSFTTENYSAVETVHFKGRDYDFAKMSGTSMSSPAVTGVCALVWEANPYLTPREVKQIIIETAREDIRTGTLPEEGDVKWGHGKVNALAAVQSALGILGTQEYFVDDNQWSVYPNPSQSTITIAGFDKMQDVKLVDMNGKVLDLDASKDNWSVANVSAGIYVLRVVANNKVYQKKLVIR